MMKSTSSPYTLFFLTTVLAYSSLVVVIDAHGHMTSPRSRNWFAHEDGLDGWGSGGQAGIPPKENCAYLVV